MSYLDDSLEQLKGKRVQNIYMDEDYLRFVTDDGTFTYEVEGDCCSHSYFYDFLGIENLFQNGPIISVEEIDMEDNGKHHDGHDCLSFYGFRFITEHPKFGEVSSVMSFRNDSNGYYGGMLRNSNFEGPIPELFEDCLGTV